jgi:hypothetical protein
MSPRAPFFGQFWRLALRGALICGLAAALLSCAWLERTERERVLRPTPGRPADFKGLSPRDVAYEVEVPGEVAGSIDRLHIWWMPNRDPRAPTLLYLHGTFRNLYPNLPKIESLRSAGFSVIAVDYRGWGDSTPILPSEASIYADAHSAWVELVRRQADPRKRVIYGHSMGTGVAVDLASKLRGGVDYGGLILEASFPRLPDVAKANGVVGTIASWFATLEFDSRSKIGKVDVPILMMHGAADKTVPIELGRQLYAVAPAGTMWVEFPTGTHSALNRQSPEKYEQAVRELIAKLH